MLVVALRAIYLTFTPLHFLQSPYFWWLKSFQENSTVQELKQCQLFVFQFFDQFWLFFLNLFIPFFLEVKDLKICLSVMEIMECCVPPGFRFHPTEEELVGYYLNRKVNSLKIDLDVITDVDLYRIEPWDIQGKFLHLFSLHFPSSISFSINEIHPLHS